MEPLSPTRPMPFPASAIDDTADEEQKLINRETSIVELRNNPGPQAATTGIAEVEPQPHDDEPCPRTATASSDRGASVAASSTDAAPAISTAPVATTSPASPSASVQLYSPTKTEIESHPIRQRFNIYGDNVAASGWGSRQEESESAAIGESGRQEQSEQADIQEKDKMTEVKEGDKVAWNWGSGAPGGTASEVVTDGDAKMVSHRGNEVKKKGSPENPAVHIERPGNDVVKKASELEVEEKGPEHKDGGDDKKDDDAEDKKEDDKKEESTNGEAKTGEKRSADEANKDDEKKDDGEADAESKTNGEAAQPPKKKGRPAKGGASAKKETKKKAPKAAATADGKPRRSGRNKA